MPGTGHGALATATANAGGVTAINLVAPGFGGSGYITGGGIQKFVDPLPGLCNPTVRPLGDPNNGSCPDWAATPGAKAIPLAVAEAKLYNSIDADEYDIGLVQYRTSFSSSLKDPLTDVPVGTLVRGYVQLETPANAAISQHFALYNELLDGTKVYIGCETATAGCATQKYAVTPPQWLGPVIAATKDKPVRIIFRNLLPADSDNTDGISYGDLFLPVDSTLMGSGMGSTPDFDY